MRSFRGEMRSPRSLAALVGLSLLCSAIAPAVGHASPPRKGNAKGGAEIDPEASDQGDAQDPVIVEARAAIEDERWDDAIEVYSEAYQETGKSEYLYNMGQVERMRRNWQKAINYYTIFINTGPPEAFKKAANQNIARCVSEMNREAAQAEELPPPEPEPEPEPKPEPAPEPDELEPWHKDVLGGVLLGSGLGLAAIGGTLVGVAHANNASAGSDNERHNDFQSQLDQASAQNTAGLVLVGIGVAALVGAGVRYGLVARKKAKRDEARATAILAPAPGGLVLTGRF